MSGLNFRIESSAKAYEILASNLYSDKISAVIRELSCNASDAHAEAGIAQIPFNVELPLRDGFDQFFKIRDFGLGLKADQIEDVFAVFFSSTKAGSKAYTGAFGLGCKSPFAITDNFFVNSYVGGVKHSYHCLKNDGVPSINFVRSESSLEPNGLEIIVPIQFSKASEWQDKAKKIYENFKIRPKTNLRCTYHNETSEYICGDNWENTKDNGVWIVMSNVRYPLDLSKVNPSIVNLDYRYKARGIIYHVPPRSISVTPSREDISYTQETINFLDNFINEVNKSIIKSIQEKIGSKPSMLLAKMAYMEIMSKNGLEYFYHNKFVSPQMFLWNGRKISEKSHIDLTIDHDQNVELGYYLKVYNHSKPSKHDLITNIPFSNSFDYFGHNLYVLINDTKASQQSIKEWAKRKLIIAPVSNIIFLVVDSHFQNIITDINKIPSKYIYKCSKENLQRMVGPSAQRNKIASKNITLYISNLENSKIEKDNIKDGEDLVAELIDENNLVHFIEFNKEYIQLHSCANPSISVKNNCLDRFFHLHEFYTIYNSSVARAKQLNIEFNIPVKKSLVIRNLKKNKLFLRQYAKNNKIKFISYHSFFKNYFISFAEANPMFVKSYVEKIFLSMLLSNETTTENFNMSLLPKCNQDFIDALHFFVSNINNFSTYLNEHKLLNKINEFVTRNNSGNLKICDTNVFSYISENMITQSDDTKKLFVSKYCDGIISFIKDFKQFYKENLLIFDTIDNKCNKIIQYCLTGKIT
jgi:hypothetical protein